MPFGLLASFVFAGRGEAGGATPQPPPPPATCWDSALPRRPAPRLLLPLGLSLAETPLGRGNPDTRVGVEAFDSLILHSALRFGSWEPRSHVTPVSFWSQMKSGSPSIRILSPPSHPCIGEIQLHRVVVVGSRLPLCPPKPPFGAKFKGSKLGPALPRRSRRCGWRGSATGPGAWVAAASHRRAGRRARA